MIADIFSQYVHVYMWISSTNFNMQGLKTKTYKRRERTQIHTIIIIVLIMMMLTNITMSSNNATILLTTIDDDNDDGKSGMQPLVAHKITTNMKTFLCMYVYVLYALNLHLHSCIYRKVMQREVLFSIWKGIQCAWNIYL